MCRCQRCQDLEEQCARRTTAYLALVDRQCQLFKEGRILPARDLDSAVRTAKRERECAVNALTRHEQTHVPRAVSTLRFGT